MSRLKRKNRNYGDLGIKSSGGMLDLFDNAIKEIYRITDEEYDYLCEKMTDAECELFATEDPTFCQKRKMLLMVDKYLTEKNG